MKPQMQQHGSIYFARRLPPHLPLHWGSRGQNSTFSNMVMLHIEFKGITNVAYIFCQQTLLFAGPCKWGQKVKIKLSEHGHFAHQAKGNHKCSNLITNNLPADHSPLPDPGGGVIRSIFFRTWPCCISN